MIQRHPRMRTKSISLILLLVAGQLTAVSNLAAAEAGPPIDPVRGRQLMEKSNRGEALTSEEQAYLERVKQTIRERAAGKQAGAGTKAGASPAVRPPGPANPNDWINLIAITDLTVPYKGEDGGLYGG